MKLKERRKGENAVETRGEGELNNEQREETEARALHTHPHPSRAWRQRLSPQSQENRAKRTVTISWPLWFALYARCTSTKLSNCSL